MPINNATHYTMQLKQSHFVTREANTGNYFGDFAELEMGDTTLTLGSEKRRSMICVWDLAVADTSPFVDVPVRKGAVLTNSSIKLTPNATEGNPGDDNDIFEFALMAPDGFWDRSTTHPLHTNQSGRMYGPPNQSSTVHLRARNATDVITGADTMLTTTGWSTVTSGGILGWFHSLACTAYIPADEPVHQIEFFVTRPVGTPSGDPDVVVKAYTLAGDGRHFAVDELIATSNAIPYLDITQSATANSFETFTFSVPIPASTSNRWLGFVVEGDWFDNSFYSSHKLNFQVRTDTLSDQTSYLSGTAGSMFLCSAASAQQFDGGLWPYYLLMTDVPCVYPVSSSVRLTTPYQRYFGTPVTNDNNSGFTDSVPYYWGHSGHTFNVSGWLALMQQWLDSSNFDPINGRTKMGMIIEVPAPEGVTWKVKGPSTSDQIVWACTWDSLPAELTAKSCGITSILSSKSEGTTNILSSKSEGIHETITSKSEGV